MTEDHHGAGISTEPGNIALDPLECRDLVQKRVVAGRVMLGFTSQVRMRHEPKDVHPIVEAHEHHALLRKPGTVVLILGSRATHIAAAVNEHHDRQFRRGALGGCPHVQIEAILAYWNVTFAPRVALGVGWRLHADGGEAICPLQTLPGNDSLRRTPAQVSYWRRRIRYSAKQPHAGSPLDRRSAGDLAAVYADRLRYPAKRHPRCRNEN